MRHLSLYVTMLCGPLAYALLGAAPDARASATSELKLYRPSPALVALGVPEDYLIGRFYVTTEFDIAYIGSVRVSSTEPLFQVPLPFGSIAEPPPPEFLPFDRRLNVDSWITTPGPTRLLGTDLPGDGTGTWADFTDDGPQNRFWFAQITGPEAYTTFEGALGLRNGEHLLRIPFHFSFPLSPPEGGYPVIPEPSARLLLAIGVFMAVGRGRRAAANRPSYANA